MIKMVKIDILVIGNKVLIYNRYSYFEVRFFLFKYIISVVCGLWLDKEKGGDFKSCRDIIWGERGKVKMEVGG